MVGSSNPFLLALAALLLAAPTLAGCFGSEKQPNIWESEWKVGDVKFSGIITNITRLETTYGPQVLLGFDEGRPIPVASGSDRYSSCRLIYGDPEQDYRIGQRFSATLHFTRVTMFGVTGISAPELACPIPILSQSMADVAHAVGWINGGSLLPLGLADGWMSYEIFSRIGFAATLEEAPIRLHEWVASVEGFPAEMLVEPVAEFPASAAQWAGIHEAAFQQLVSHLNNFQDGFNYTRQLDDLELGSAMANDRLRFVDMNRDGSVGDADRLEVRLPPEPHGYKFYILSLGECATGCASAPYFVLNGPKGPLDYDAAPAEGELLDLEEAPSVQILYEGHTLDDPITTTYRIGRARGPERRVTELEFSLYPSDADDRDGRHPLQDGVETQVKGGFNVTFFDENRNALVDLGDTLEIAGGRPYQYVGMNLLDLPSGSASNRMVWVNGHGPVRGHGPTFYLDASEDARTAIVLTQYLGKNPQRPHFGPHPDLAFNETVTVTLRQGQTILVDRAAVRDGIVGHWPDGVLVYNDMDTSGGVSDEDVISIATAVDDEFEVTMEVLYGWHSSSVRLRPVG